MPETTENFYRVPAKGARHGSWAPGEIYRTKKLKNGIKLLFRKAADGTMVLVTVLIPKGLVADMAAAKKYVKAHQFSAEQPMVVMKGVEVFKTGLHRNAKGQLGTYTKERLDSWVENRKSLPFDPAIDLGQHTDGYTADDYIRLYMVKDGKVVPKFGGAQSLSVVPDERSEGQFRLLADLAMDERLAKAVGKDGFFQAPSVVIRKMPPDEEHPEEREFLSTIALLAPTVPPALEGLSLPSMSLDSPSGEFSQQVVDTFSKFVADEPVLIVRSEDVNQGRQEVPMSDKEKTPGTEPRGSVDDLSSLIKAFIENAKGEGHKELVAQFSKVMEEVNTRQADQTKLIRDQMTMIKKLTEESDAAKLARLVSEAQLFSKKLTDAKLSEALATAASDIYRELTLGAAAIQFSGVEGTHTPAIAFQRFCEMLCKAGPVGTFTAATEEVAKSADADSKPDVIAFSTASAASAGLPVEKAAMLEAAVKHGHIKPESALNIVKNAKTRVSQGGEV